LCLVGQPTGLCRATPTSVQSQSDENLNGRHYVRVNVSGSPSLDSLDLHPRPILAPKPQGSLVASFA
jgi:hypothetical protein